MRFCVKNTDVLVPLQIDMKKASVLFLLFVLVLPSWASSEDFFLTSAVNISRREHGMSYSVKVDFPVQGNSKAMYEIKRWICERLSEWVDTPASPQNMDVENFKVFLDSCSLQYFTNNSAGQKERIEIYRSYEDEEVVTYEFDWASENSVVRSRDQDCVSVSKADGHRIQANEIFKCGEDEIKQLMWEWRGDLPVEGLSPKDLVVGDMAFIDGWIIVIGPANGYLGAEYRIRYQAAAPYLRAGKHGDYYNAR